MYEDHLNTKATNLSLQSITDAPLLVPVMPTSTKLKFATLMMIVSQSEFIRKNVVSAYLAITSEVLEAVN